MLLFEKYQAFCSTVTLFVHCSSRRCDLLWPLAVLLQMWKQINKPTTQQYNLWFPTNTDQQYLSSHIIVRTDISICLSCTKNGDFLQLAAEKKTPFLVQLKKIFSPTYNDRA